MKKKSTTARFDDEVPISKGDIDTGNLVRRRRVVGRVFTPKTKITRGSGNLFRDLGFGKEEAGNLKLRSELMMRIEDYFEKSGMTQAQAAKQLGLTAPRFNALLKGKIGLFSLDALVNLAARSGLSVRLQIRKAA